VVVDVATSLTEVVPKNAVVEVALPVMSVSVVSEVKTAVVEGVPVVSVSTAVPVTTTTVVEAEADSEADVEVEGMTGTADVVEEETGPELAGLDDDVRDGKMGPDAPDPPDAPRATKECSADEGPDRFWFEPFKSSTLWPVPMRPFEERTCLFPYKPPEL